MSDFSLEAESILEFARNFNGHMIRSLSIPAGCPGNRPRHDLMYPQLVGFSQRKYRILQDVWRTIRETVHLEYSGNQKKGKKLSNFWSRNRDPAIRA